MEDRILEQKQAEKRNSIERGSSLIMAVVLIAVGGLLLLNNVTGVRFDDWWVLFILIPLGGIAAKAWTEYQTTGRVGASPIIGGGFMLVFMASFIFDLDWGELWPIGLIIGGLAALLSWR